MVRRTGAQVSDTGARNIGVRETTDDIGLGGVDPFGHALSAAAGALATGEVFAADGTFKIPGLRNVELTAPYFHNGGEATLLDVVNFYARGGNLDELTTRDPLVTIAPLSILNFNTAADAAVVKADLVEFLKSLTDERVKKAAAPFDHPQLFVPNGHPGNTTNVIQLNGRAVDTMLEIPATGKNGGPVLPGFLE
jgi:cytochrome c peroxidase